MNQVQFKRIREFYTCRLHLEEITEAFLEKVKGSACVERVKGCQNCPYVRYETEIEE